MEIFGLNHNKMSNTPRQIKGPKKKQQKKFDMKHSQDEFFIFVMWHGWW
jgi:hypothetical protein